MVLIQYQAAQPEKGAHCHFRMKALVITIVQHVCKDGSLEEEFGTTSGISEVPNNGSL